MKKVNKTFFLSFLSAAANGRVSISLLSFDNFGLSSDLK